MLHDYHNIFSNINRMALRYKTKKQKRRYSKARRQYKNKLYTLRNKKRQLGGERSCIIVDMIDHEGLGNKLGIFGAALMVKEKINRPICIFGTTTPHSSRDYASLFDAEKIEPPADMDKIRNIMKPRRDTNSFSKNTVDYPNTNNGRGNIKITQILYQNYKSLLPVVPAIRDMLIRNEFQKEEYTPCKLPAGETSAFLHLRLGDYKALGWNQPDTYYTNALKKLNELDTEKLIKTIYVFSNEPAACKEHMKTWQALVPEKNMEIKDVDELKTLYMMMQCKAGAIISGSTFSSWGGMLGPNDNPKAIVIYPKDMAQFLGATNPMSFPDNWHMISA
jgi:hypothetical protein